MKIITRGEAMRIHRQHPASRLFPFCTGKYRWPARRKTKGSCPTLIGAG